MEIPGIVLEEELGRGASSVVYRARHGEALRAVKIPRMRGRWTRWVYREAVSLARVKHPGLPAVVEVGEVDGLPYLVMDLVEGETLASRLDRGPLSEPEVVDLGVQIASMLHAVHEVGLVHRDVKPGNVILMEDGRVRLVDFGFATSLERRAARGELAGTPSYAAPEQFRAPSRIDGRTDLYALGRVLCEAVTGQLPDAAQKHSSVLAELLENGVSAWFAQVLAALTATSPTDRYPNASATMADLQAVREGRAPKGARAYDHTASRPSRPPIGLEIELELLLRAWSEVRASGRNVLWQGRRGIGKTMLLKAFVDRARDAKRGHVIELSSYQGDPPLAALRRLVESFVQHSTQGPTGAVLALRTAAANDLKSLVRLIAPKYSEMFGADGTDSTSVPTSIAEGVSEFLVRLARVAGPLLICADDFQWIDPVSRDALVSASNRVGEAPFMLAIATRERTPAVERILSGSQNQITSFELETFDERKVFSLIASYLNETDVEQQLVRHVAALADGTPLGVLEVLGAFLDAGALRPHAGSWRFDTALADQVVLPDGIRALLWRRVAELPPATRRVLEVAAVVGSHFDEALAAQVVGLSTHDLGYAIAQSHRAELLQFESGGKHRFVHDSLREMLLQSCDATTRKRINQRVAELLEDAGAANTDALCASARHYEAGELDKAPERAYRVARAAASSALERFDNETALHFLEFARKAAAVASIHLNLEFHQAVGETLLRLGSLEKSLEAFERALAEATAHEARATILGRIAWVHQARASSEEAWSTLERAFTELGTHLPNESAASVVTLMRALATSRIKREKPGASSGAPNLTKHELLAELHYQNARLGLEYGKPARLLQSTLGMLSASAPLGPSRGRARALAYSGFIQTALIGPSVGAGALAEAQAIASKLGDPATAAFCVQIRSVAASFAGDVDRALTLFGECVSEYGPWLELHEYCYNIATCDLIESVRGRSTAAWQWIARALHRIERSNQSDTDHLDYVIHRAHATLAGIASQPEKEAWLTGQLRKINRRPEPRGFHRTLSWGPRIRLLLERGELGAPFEDLIQKFESEGHNPRTGHAVLAEYYVVVAQGRMHQCLRTSAANRATHLPRLRRAIRDLRAAAKMDGVRAHVLLGEGYVAWFEGSLKKARQLLAKAESLAEREGCPWVLYGVARARAHILRDDGRNDEARVQARIAEFHATEHGAIRRALWIREEFSLTPPKSEMLPNRSTTASTARSTRRAQHQLATLLQIVRAARPDIPPHEQASALLSDLSRELDAERAVLRFHPDPALTARLQLSVDRSGYTTSDIERHHAELVRYVYEKGDPWPAENGDPHGPHFGSDVALPDRRRTLVAPLFLFDRIAGALCLERRPADSPFSREDREVILLLAQHLPMVLEMSRLVSEREQLEASLRQAQKMETAGQLAGGVAHDFNNMLTAIQNSLNFVREHEGLDAEIVPELEIMTKAAKQAAALSNQLLTFSRNRPAPLSALDINGLLSQLEPILRRLLGESSRVVLDLDPHVPHVTADPTALDQAIVNLTLNARDAMEGGGTLTVRTKRVTLGQDDVRRGAPAAGDYVAIEVSDTGFGMNAETLERIFEPFFTTKPLGRGTGLGLAMVYTAIKDCGGYTDVTSVPDHGTTFRLHLPAPGTSGRRTRTPPVPRRDARAPMILSGKSASPPPVVRNPQAPPRSETILVVDDDSLLGESIKRILQRDGYPVLMASRADEALELTRERGAEISLVILDVLMPEISGPELGRQLRALPTPPRLLFVSGFAQECLPPYAADVLDEAFLQKPFSGNALLARVRELLDGPRPTSRAVSSTRQSSIDTGI